MNSVVETQLVAVSIEETDCLQHNTVTNGDCILAGEQVASIDGLPFIDKSRDPSAMKNKAPKERKHDPAKATVNHRDDLMHGFPSFNTSHLREFSQKLESITPPSSKEDLTSRVLEMLSQSFLQELGNRLHVTRHKPNEWDEDDEDELQDSIHLAKARLLKNGYNRKRTLDKLEDVVGTLESTLNAELKLNSYRAVAA
jgi:hypothetical protein